MKNQLIFTKKLYIMCTSWKSIKLIIQLKYAVCLNSILKKFKIINFIAETLLINISIHRGMDNPWNNYSCKKKGI